MVSGKDRTLDFHFPRAASSQVLQYKFSEGKDEICKGDGGQELYPGFAVSGSLQFCAVAAFYFLTKKIQHFF